MTKFSALMLFWGDRKRKAIGAVKTIAVEMAKDCPFGTQLGLE